MTEMTGEQYNWERRRLTGLDVRPGTRGPRGGIYDWQVFVVATGETVYSAARQSAAEAFVEGAYYAKGGPQT